MSERRDGHTGPGLVEYALIVALVASVVIGTLILLGPQLTSILQDFTSTLSL
jgi:Flp pilus assembly pilin Flp